jgi:DNA-binding FrmR family transcriptional regulator
MGPVPNGGIHGRGAEMGTDEITNRLKRIEGQIRGLQRMVGEQRDCEAILTQLMAARAALDRVGLLVVDDFVQECVLSADGAVARQRVNRVLELVFSRFSIPMSAETMSPENPIEAPEEE